MSDREKNFHNFALSSNLFKGHSDLYFCFLKSERIAHVSVILHQRAGVRNQSFDAFVDAACMLPSSVVHLAAGDAELREVLAEVFSLMTLTRLLATNESITKESAQVLLEEFELLAQKIDAGTRLSPFVTSDDFLVHPATEQQDASLTVKGELAKRLPETPRAIKDIDKGHVQKKPLFSKGQQGRLGTILDLVRSGGGLSIKDISAVVKDCSEKTIQRELAELIRQGLIRRVGERRWSLYEPVPDA